MGDNGVSDVFRQAMGTWVQLMNKKAEVNRDMKVINDKLKDLKAFLTEVMVEKKIDGANCSGQRVTLTTTKSKEPMSRDVIVRLMNEYTKADNPEHGKIADFILDNRKVRESHGLKISPIPGYAFAVKEQSARSGIRDEPLGDTASSASAAITLRRIKEADRPDPSFREDESHFSEDGSCS
jgi:hypothetical protein